MLRHCYKLNQPLDNWNTNNITYIQNTFIGTKILNYKFQKIKMQQTKKSNEINSMKCIICMDNGYDKLYKMCSNENNDHYYCEECSNILNKVQYCICKTNPYIT